MLAQEECEDMVGDVPSGFASMPGGGRGGGGKYVKMNQAPESSFAHIYRNPVRTKQDYGKVMGVGRK